nr:hypothetical protein [Streptomyces sp. TLI_235]
MRKAEKQPLGTSQASHARRQFNEARGFLAWLAGRGGSPDQSRQQDLDAWHVHSNHAAATFLRWCTESGHLPN